ncbi:unnamed protein product, partial [Lymnaea stagnalis]
HHRIFNLPKLFDVKSYHPYTCRDVRQLCLPTYRAYEKILSENSFQRSSLQPHMTSFLSKNEDFHISIIARNDVLLWTERAEQQQQFFNGGNKKSFLQRTFGVYSYKEQKKDTIYFSVTNNVLPNELAITEKYALKGYVIQEKNPT